ncbi:MAG: hypothetical protein JXA82_18800 [Sedimentisphaerales bacterium]|nr:hypothetical protein [Sedimentisphaerales bacterium]
MATNQRNISRGTLFVVLLLGGFFLLMLPQRYTLFLTEGFHRILGPVLSVGRPTEISKIHMVQPGQDAVSQDTYNKLYTIYRNTYAQLLEIQQQLSTLQRIRAGLPTPGPPLILARVSNAILTAEECALLVIPVSGTEELEQGQYVIGDDSVIGTISAVYKTSARVRLVTDAKHRMLVAIGRTGRSGYIQAYMHGQGDGTTRIVGLSQKEYDVREGDAVYAAADGDRLGTEVIIGEVREVRHDLDNPLLWDIRVVPVCQAEKLSEIGIVVMHPKSEIKSN